MKNTTHTTNIELNQHIIFEVEVKRETEKAVLAELIYYSNKEEFQNIAASFEMWMPKSAVVGNFESIAPWMLQKIQSEVYRRN